MTRLLATAAVVCSFVLGGEASANDDVMKLTQDPNQWVLQTGDYANTR